MKTIKILTLLVLFASNITYAQSSGQYVWTKTSDMNVNGRSTEWRWVWVPDVKKPDTVQLVVDQLIKDFAGNIIGWKSDDGSVTMIKEKPKPLPKPIQPANSLPDKWTDAVAVKDYKYVLNTDITDTIYRTYLSWQHKYTRKKVAITRIKKIPAKKVPKEPVFVFRGTGVVEWRIGDYVMLNSAKGTFTKKK